MLPMTTTAQSFQVLEPVIVPIFVLMMNLKFLHRTTSFAVRLFKSSVGLDSSPPSGIVFSDSEFALSFAHLSLSKAFARTGNSAQNATYRNFESGRTFGTDQNLAILVLSGDGCQTDATPRTELTRSAGSLSPGKFFSASITHMLNHRGHFWPFNQHSLVWQGGL